MKSSTTNKNVKQDPLPSENSFGTLSKDQLINVILSIQGTQAHKKDTGGISLSYEGKTNPWEIQSKVKPKKFTIKHALGIGTEEQQCKNLLIDGENLSALVTLYKYKEQVDLIVTDPPYNTGEDFRYNDKWENDPNDPDLGNLVPKDDGSRHSKWLKFMSPRLWMMWNMLKPGGVLAICIDDNEVFRLGILLDEIFGEDNRIGIVNWQKSYSPKSDNKHLSTATEYVLVYSKDKTRAKTNLLPRDAAMNARYKNPDNDPADVWSSDNPTAPSGDAKSKYGIQSPFTGEIFYPGDNFWRTAKETMKTWLSNWGVEYEYQDINDGLKHTDKNTGKSSVVKAIVIKGCKFSNGKPVKSDAVIQAATIAANAILERGQWPTLIFTDQGNGGPRIKRYLKDVKQGKVAMSYWATDEYETSIALGCQSWGHEESGHSQQGFDDLVSVVGSKHGFKTAKPLKLMKKIIQLWCPPNGLVLDPFAGSGTTGQAVLEMNVETASDRRFILIEKGNDDKGDYYARTLTQQRLSKVITGKRHSGKAQPIDNGFGFWTLEKEAIDADAVCAMEREEMIDVLLTSHWEKAGRSKKLWIERVTKKGPATSKNHLFAKNKENEGYFLIWDTTTKEAELNQQIFDEIIDEIETEGLSSNRVHIYARTFTYRIDRTECYKIPDRVLEHVGLSANNDSFGRGK